MDRWAAIDTLLIQIGVGTLLASSSRMYSWSAWWYVCFEEDMIQLARDPPTSDVRGVFCCQHGMQL